MFVSQAVGHVVKCSSTHADDIREIASQERKTGLQVVEHRFAESKFFCQGQLPLEVSKS